jgi:transposase
LTGLSLRSTQGTGRRSRRSRATWLKAYSLGVAAEMPQAAQSVDRFHVVQLLNRAIDPVRCQERRESAEKRRQLAGTKYVWPKKKESLTKRQLARREELDPAKTHLREARACQMGEALQDIYSCADRKSAAGPWSASARGWRTLPWPR